MSGTPYKYKINHFLSFLPRQMSIADFAYMLEKDYMILRDEFNGDRFLKTEDNRIIPPERLRTYARLFRVEENQLKNFKDET